MFFFHAEAVKLIKITVTEENRKERKKKAEKHIAPVSKKVQ